MDKVKDFIDAYEDQTDLWLALSDADKENLTAAELAEQFMTSIATIKTLRRRGFLSVREPGKKARVFKGCAMPSKMSAAIKASDLIKQAQADDFVMPCDEALAELKKVLAYNDAAGGRQTHMRISAEKTCKMLETWGYPCCRGKLQIICQRLGRKSYAYAK